MRVLVTTTPGLGHIHPMLPLARAFQDGGDEVLWTTAGRSRSQVEEAGFRTAPAGRSDDVMAETLARYPEIGALPPDRRPDVLFGKLFGAGRTPAMLADLLPIAADFAPDLVVSDAADLAGPIVAAKHGVPGVAHSFGALLPAKRLESAAVEVASLWVDQGLDPRPYCGVYDHGYIDIYPPSLQSQERPHIARTFRLRPSMDAVPAESELPSLVTAPSTLPLVYLTFGTVFNQPDVLRTVVDGASGLDVRLVVTVGPDGDPAALGEQPPNVHVTTYIPQDALLPKCDAVVSHAGSGTFLAALATGLPQLCVPQGADQFLNAAACTATGIGVALPPSEVTAESVRTALSKVLLEHEIRNQVTVLQNELLAMPTASDVAAELRAGFGS